nr:MAG: hypothetical protein [Bacteriophage sp.]
MKDAFIHDEINKKTEKMTNEELKKYKRPLPTERDTIQVYAGQHAGSADIPST